MTGGNITDSGEHMSGGNVTDSGKRYVQRKTLWNPSERQILNCCA